MSDSYFDRFICYANDIQRMLRLSEEETLNQLAQLIPMSHDNKIDLADRLSTLRSRCCSECFRLGLELGLRIASEFPLK